MDGDQLINTFAEDLTDHHFEVVCCKANKGEDGGDRVGKREVLIRTSGYGEAYHFYHKHRQPSDCYLDFILVYPKEFGCGERNYHSLMCKLPFKAGN